MAGRSREARLLLELDSEMKLACLRTAPLGIYVVLAATGCASEATENVGGDASRLGAEVTAERLAGIDVSHHQPAVDWEKVKGARQSFAFARTSDGLTQPDGTFTGHWQEMKRVGLVRGAYQFFRARRDGVAQADLLLQMVADAGGFEPGDLPPVLDFETADNQPTDVVISRAHAWLDRIEERLGVRPIVYTGNHMTPVMGTEFKDYVLWVAHYGVSSPRIPRGWTRWHFWQTADTGTVAGVTGPVDTNLFNGGLSDLMTLTLVAPIVSKGPSAAAHAIDAVVDETEGDVPPDAHMGDGIRAAK